MKLTEDEINSEPLCHSAFFRSFLQNLNELIGDYYDIKIVIHRPGNGDVENTAGISGKTALILWGDEQSQVFPEVYYKAAGVVIKCYCPESWEKQGVIPMTDVAMNWTPEDDERKVAPCSERPYTVMFSANLNYRRTDIYRGLCGRKFGYPFRISSNYPITGQYPLWHKVEAVLMHKLITRLDSRVDFSAAYPNSYIRFNRGFCNGSLSKEEYFNRLENSKISWCTAGFMTNETSRLIESANAGCAIICGSLPNNEIYAGAPFMLINDWRKVRQVTDEILNDPARMDEMGAAAKSWYISHFAPEVQARRIAKKLGVLP